MVKKLLEIFKKRQYVTEKQRKIVESDLKKELEEAEKKATYQYREYKRKNMEIQVFREILEESNHLYTESEINLLYHSILQETQKL